MRTLEEIEKIIESELRNSGTNWKTAIKIVARRIYADLNEAYECGKKKDKTESIPLVWKEHIDGEGNTFYSANIEESGELYYHIDPWFDAYLIFGGDELIDMRASVETHPDELKTLEESKQLCQEHYDRMSGRGK
jgi:hypothetical protein